MINPWGFQAQTQQPMQQPGGNFFNRFYNAARTGYTAGMPNANPQMGYNPHQAFMGNYGNRRMMPTQNLQGGLLNYALGSGKVGKGVNASTVANLSNPFGYFG